MSDSLQTIVERYAAATPGPHDVDVIDQDAGCRSSKNWVITGLARERYGSNSVSFGEDEKTARFVAAAFSDVPVMAARLQKAEQVLATMENLINRNGVIPGDYFLAAEELREALSLDDAA